MKKRFFLLVSVSLLLSMVLFAQGAKETKVVAEKGDTTISIISEWSSDTATSKIFREKIAAVDAADNGIKVVSEMIGDEKSYYNKLRTRFATGEFPDIFFDYGGARTADYVESGILVDLQPFLDADPEWKADFLPILDNWRYEAHPGALYGLPTGFYVVGLFYNKAIFAELGLKAPTTMKEFEQVSDALMKAGYIPLSLGEKDVYRAGHIFNNLVMKSYGSEAVTALGNRTLSYDDPKIMKLYQMLFDYNNRGYFGANTINKDANMAKTDFHSGKAAMHFDGTWYLGTAVSSPIADDISFIPFPTINPEFTNSWQGGTNGGLSVVNTGDKVKVEKAVQLLKELTSGEFAKEQQAAVRGGVYPVFFESDPAVVSRISIEVADAYANAEEFRSDIQNYDTNPKMLETVRVALQGLFVGKTPKQCADEIMLVVNSEK